ncbi:MAG: lysophospholipid acyltransferase family protein [Anaerolineaceae bacterium]|nr:lysophospholipid acyltransferase family protein [Anaerolineaceae bacterium]
MRQNSYLIPYPRRSFFRWACNGLARALLRVLTRCTVTGLEHIPQSGATILAVNHVDLLEVVLVASFPKRQVELIGNGDIPFDPSYGWIVKAYGFIPVNRGNLDRKSLQMGMDVLHQGGVLGIFPEGGVWDQGNMEPQIGVSLLSQRTQTPVIPVACGGMKGSLSAALHFRRPEISMTIGQPIMPPPPSNSYDKGALKNHARKVLAAIQSLLPIEEQNRISAEDQFDVSELVIEEAEPVNEGFSEIQSFVLAKFFSTKDFIDTLDINLRLPVQPLLNAQQPWQAVYWEHSIDSILAYTHQNPGFFNYRFGIEAGLHVAPALKKLREVIKKANSLSKILRMQIRHSRRFVNGEIQTSVLEYRILPDH